ncbi:MAG TPA: carboxypeptidase-like regulatory domain-containing protein [Cyclobacteriaceae bacterium]|jgi:ABC-type antimicrobial peptide transport system permease subunit|nr:carboxypeptidase-like regulatory domain-containing protein [Cyclobacteriaceae bacterium]HRK52974.1 carboxypeptidase-like regulatory domain-containing protein [Cyclobacteriaceae bacterium]
MRHINMKWFFFFLALILGVSATDSFAQSKKRVIQLSGIILSEDSVSGLPGVHIYVPKAGRGTTSNRTGYFSMPVLEGDSVVISSVGYNRRHYIVPKSISEYLTIIVEMVPDVTYLQEVEIMPFPTEEVFKEAVLALNIPMDNGVDPRAMNAELLALMLRTTPMDGAANYRYYMDQYTGSVNDRFQPRTNPFLNPFNWARFFRDLKRERD